MDGEDNNTSQYETVQLQDYLHWFERHLLAIASYDLEDLLGTLFCLDENTTILKNLASEYKSSLAVLPLSQNNKAQKIFDQIEALAIFLPNSPSFPTPMAVPTATSVSSSAASSYNNKGPHLQTQVQILSILPDSELLKDTLLKNKSKLKALEDLASAKKIDAGKAKASLKGSSGSSSSAAPPFPSLLLSRDKDNGSAKKDKAAAGTSGAGGSGGDMAAVRHEVRRGLLLLEELESLIGRKSFM